MVWLIVMVLVHKTSAAVGTESSLYTQFFSV